MVERRRCTIWRRMKSLNMGQSFFVTELLTKGILSLQEESRQVLIWDFGSRKGSQAPKLQLPLNIEGNTRGEVLFGVNLN